MKRVIFFVSIVVLAGCFGAHRENTADANNVCTDIECGDLGCCADHCCALVPSNATDFGDVEETGLVIASPDGTFDTDVDCVATSALGTCTVVTRTDLPEACVCRSDELTIGTLRVKGARALVLMAKKNVIVKQMIDVGGEPGVGGPGATRRYEGTVNIVGAPGGSFATTGAASTSTCCGGSAAAATYGESSLVPLLGGMNGKDGGKPGGGGGGALQITAGERVEIQGVINAGGGGGRGGDQYLAVSGGAGGGSGGGILVEAPSVVVSGAIVATGGGGGGGGGTYGVGASGVGGGDGSDPMAAAPGGNGHEGAGCSQFGYVAGGDGGAGDNGPLVAQRGDPDVHNGCSGVMFVGAGGGGGGVGRIRINTATGCQCGGSKVAPQASFGTLAKQ